MAYVRWNSGHHAVSQALYKRNPSPSLGHFWYILSHSTPDRTYSSFLNHTTQGASEDYGCCLLIQILITWTGTFAHSQTIHLWLLSFWCMFKHPQKLQGMLLSLPTVPTPRLTRKFLIYQLFIAHKLDMGSAASFVSGFNYKNSREIALWYGNYKNHGE